MMGRKDFSTWLKTGLIIPIIFAIFLIFMQLLTNLVHFDDSSSFAIIKIFVLFLLLIGGIIILPIQPFEDFGLTSGGEIVHNPTIIGWIVLFFIWFIIGSIIGLIYGKIKSNKENKNKILESSETTRSKQF